MPEKPVVPFAKTPEFYCELGYFYAIWSQIELAIDYAIWKALGTETPEEAHTRSADALVGDRRVALPHAKQLAQMLVSSPLGDRELDVLELVQLQRVVGAYS
jgi:hypothetical protein